MELTLDEEVLSSEMQGDRRGLKEREHRLKVRLVACHRLRRRQILRNELDRVLDESLLRGQVRVCGGPEAQARRRAGS